MTLEQLLEDETTTTKNLEAYFKTVGINNLDRKKLDKIISKFGVIVFKMYCFPEVYKIVLDRETSKRVYAWTYVIGIMSIIYTGATILMLLE